MIPAALIAGKLAYLHIVCGVFLKKIEETRQVEEKRRCGRPKKTVYSRQNLQVISSRNRKKSVKDLTQDLRAAYPSIAHLSLIWNNFIGRVAVKLDSWNQNLSSIEQHFVNSLEVTDGYHEALMGG